MISKIVVQTVGGGTKWEIPFAGWDFTEEINKDRTANLRFSRQNIQAIADIYAIQDEFIFTAGYREVYIYDENDNILYSGYISESTLNQNKANETINISSKGFFSLLEKRITEAYKYFDSTNDITDIVEYLLNYTQGLDFGNLGLVMGAKPTTRGMQRTFKYDNIKTAIEKMSNANINDGIDFDVDHLKNLNCYYPYRGSVRKNIIFEDGFNILTYSVHNSFINQMANQVIVFGEGQDENMPVVVRNAEDAYKENYFLLQYGLSEKDTATIANLESKGDKYLSLNKMPRKSITMTVAFENPVYSEYGLGDWVKIKIPKRSIDSFYRLTKRTLNDLGEVSLAFSPI